MTPGSPWGSAALRGVTWVYPRQQAAERASACQQVHRRLRSAGIPTESEGSAGFRGTPGLLGGNSPQTTRGRLGAACALLLFAHVAQGLHGATKRLDTHPRARPTPRITHGLTAASLGLAALAHHTIPMPIYRYQEPPTKRQCRDCHAFKFTASQFDWVKGWPSTHCKECRREHDQRRYHDKVANQANREHMNAQRRARYRLAKERAAQAAAYDALPAHERARIDEAARKAKADLEAAERLRAAKVAYGRWREREIRAGRMQRPPNVNPYTGKPRPTKEEQAQAAARRTEDAPRPAPPRWSELMQASKLMDSQRLAARRTAILHPHRVVRVAK